MKKYSCTEKGCYIIDGMHIPNDPGNRHYKEMMKEVASGEAEIIDYTPDE